MKDSFSILKNKIMKTASTSDLGNYHIGERRKFKGLCKCAGSSEPSGFAHTIYDLFVCFVVLGPKSTAMVMAGQSVHLTTLFPGQA